MNGSSSSSYSNLYWMILLIGICLVCSLEPRSSAGAQQGESKPVQNPKEEPQTIRLGTQLVNVFFSVTDRKNQYINDLSKNEVMVLENGRPQQIFTFKHEVDLPLTVAILVDISNSVRSIIPRLTSASSKFLNSVMRPEIDTSALIQFDSEATLIEDLTSNLGRLSGSLQELEHSLSLPPKREGILPPPVTAGSRRGGTAIYDAVVAVSQDLLAPRKGRKTIILFTDGQDTTSFTKREEAVDLAIHTETIIYAIGIGRESDETVNKKDLNKLCEQTGGRAYIPKTVQDLDRAFAQLEQELRQQYLLAYEPANDQPDGGFRRIEVRLRNRKDLAVHHRPGYYAVKP